MVLTTPMRLNGKSWKGHRIVFEEFTVHERSLDFLGSLPQLLTN